MYKAIYSSFVILRTAIENTFGVPDSLAILVVAAIAGFLLWATYRRRLDMFDAIIALTLLSVLATLAWARTITPNASAPELGETVRYGYAVVLLLTLLVVPKLRLPAVFGWPRRQWH